MMLPINMRSPPSPLPVNIISAPKTKCIIKFDFEGPLENLDRYVARNRLANRVKIARIRFRFIIN